MKLDELLKVAGKTKEWALDSKIVSEKEALKTVKQNGYALPYVRDQTEAICLEAVKQTGYALLYVN